MQLTSAVSFLYCFCLPPTISATSPFYDTLSRFLFSFRLYLPLTVLLCRRLRAIVPLPSCLGCPLGRDELLDDLTYIYLPE